MFREGRDFGLDKGGRVGGVCWEGVEGRGVGGMSEGGGWISAVTLNVARICVEKLMYGWERGTFSCVIHRKFLMSSRVSGGELVRDVWEVKDLL